MSKPVWEQVVNLLIVLGVSALPVVIVAVMWEPPEWATVMFWTINGFIILEGTEIKDAIREGRK